jgi:UDP-2,3-diacylglucosamine pyrophosphatase LpxH
MSKIKIVLSDLHLADGNSVFEGFGDFQQSALEGLLSATTIDGFTDHVEDVELIINGDCFEFLFMEPHEKEGIASPEVALSKLERVITGHQFFFKALQNFISQSGRHATIMIGNHDVELAFREIQERIAEVICDGPELKDRLNFCPCSFYRPLPDVHIEHGNQYDFWNRIRGLWVENGLPLTLNPSRITLPLGTRYVQHASYPINLQYPYFDRFQPAMNLTPQLGILCLLNPEIVITTVEHAIEMLSKSRNPFACLASEDKKNAVIVFDLAMRELATFQEELVAQHPDFIEPSSVASRIDAMNEFISVREALTLPPTDAIKSIFKPSTYRMAESVAIGMLNRLQSDPDIRFAIAGHTHMARINSINDEQVYLNSGAWTTRYALPQPHEITPDLITWLSKPDWNAIPFRDRTQLVFALIHAEEGSPSRANLCIWQGGEKGSYHVLQ